MDRHLSFQISKLNVNRWWSGCPACDLGLPKAVGLPLCSRCCWFSWTWPTCFHTQASWQQPREGQHSHCTGLLVLSPRVPCWPMWANIAVTGSMDDQPVLHIKERAREWSCNHLGFIHCIDGCNWTFSAEPQGEKPKQDAAPAKHPCPWQQHLLVCSGGTSGMVPPHCWALQKALLCTPSWWAAQYPMGQGPYWLWERHGGDTL